MINPKLYDDVNYVKMVVLLMIDIFCQDLHEGVARVGDNALDRSSIIWGAHKLNPIRNVQDRSVTRRVRQL
jgi:hypothetical protein